MKTIKNILKRSTLATLSALFAIAFVANVFSMRMTPQQMERAKGAVKRTMGELKQQEKSYFIYDKDNPENGIWIDKELAKEKSKTIKAMTDEETNKIPLPCSVDIIKLGFDLLGKKVDIKLSLGQLVDVANLFNFLEVPADTMKTVLVKIKESIDKSDAKNINEELKKMPPELQELIMLEPSINCLQNCIIKKYAKNRTKSLVGIRYRGDVLSVAFSSDGTKIAAGFQAHLALWNISNPHNIIHQTLVHRNGVTAVAFSPDSTKIVSGCYGDQNNIFLWDISNPHNTPHNIVHQALVGHQNDILSVAFNHDGTKIVSGCLGNQNNLILWDISDPHNITQKTLIGHLGGVNSVAFSRDGTKIVSGGYGEQDNLILWNISDLQNITHQTLVNNPKTVTAVAFSPDGTKIVFGCLGNENNLILCDISDLQNIKSQPLVGHPNTVKSVAFNHDGTKIVSGCLGEQDNLILWDISDLQNIVHQTLGGHPKNVNAVAFSPDSTKIVFGCSGFQNHLIILTLLTDQENTLLKQLKNYTVDQIRLIYQLCLQSLKNQRITLQEGSEEHTIFMTLPEDMQRLLTDLFNIRLGLFGWW